MEPLADAGGFYCSGPTWPEVWKEGYHAGTGRHTPTRKGGNRLYRVPSFRVSPQEKKETGRYVILYEESCFIDRISLTFHTIV